MSSKNQTEPNTTPGPVPLPPNRRASFSQNPSFQTLFGGQRSSPPKAAPDPSLTRRFSWSWAPPPQKESSSAIDDSDDLVSSPLEDQRRGSEIGRRLSSTASTLREALGLKFDEPPSPGTGRTVPYQPRKQSEPAISPTAPPEGGAQSFMQRRRASFGKTRKEADPHADRMLQGHFSVD